MKALTIFGEILPITGTILLLGLWNFQQTEVNSISSELEKLDRARNTYLTFRSNNELYNVMFELSDKSTTLVNLRKLQMNNIERGLSYLESNLTRSERANIPPPITNLNPSDRIEKMIERTQLGIKVIPKKITLKEEKLRAESKDVHRAYNWAYIIISSITILGSIFKVLDKLSSMKAN